MKNFIRCVILILSVPTSMIAISQISGQLSEAQLEEFREIGERRSKALCQLWEKDPDVCLTDCEKLEKRLMNSNIDDREFQRLLILYTEVKKC